MRYQFGNTQRTHEAVASFNDRLNWLAAEALAECGHDDASKSPTLGSTLCPACGWYVSHA